MLNRKRSEALKDELNSVTSTLRDTAINESEVKSKFVGAALYLSSEFFKTIFVKTIGLEGLARWTSRLDLPSKEIEPYQLSYYCGYASQYATGGMRYFFMTGIARNFLVSGFTATTVKYTINLASAIPVAFNYIFRNVGKILGWTLVAPYTIPAYLLIKPYFAIKKSYYKSRIDSILDKMNDLELVTANLDSNIKMKKIAARLNTEEFTNALTHYQSKSLKRDLKNDRTTNMFSNPDTFSQYATARTKVLNSARRWSLAKTILSGIFIIPLFFTIPAHQRLLEQQSIEKSLIEENDSLLKEVESKNERIDSSSISTRRSRWLDDQSELEQVQEISADQTAKKLDTHHRAGDILLELRRPDLAKYYYSKTPKESKHYNNDMNQLGTHLRAVGETSLANAVLKEASSVRDKQADKVLESLASSGLSKFGKFAQTGDKGKEVADKSLRPNSQARF